MRKALPDVQVLSATAAAYSGAVSRASSPKPDVTSWDEAALTLVKLDVVTAAAESRDGGARFDERAAQSIEDAAGWLGELFAQQLQAARTALAVGDPDLRRSDSAIPFLHGRGGGLGLGVGTVVSTQCRRLPVHVGNCSRRWSPARVHVVDRFTAQQAQAPAEDLGGRAEMFSREDRPAMLIPTSRRLTRFS